MKLKAKIKGTNELTRKFQQLQEITRSDILYACAYAGALLLQNSMAEKAPYKTGTLRRSITIEIIRQTATTVILSVGTNVIYAAIQEFGGTIQAKGLYLTFRIDGNVIRVPSVTIPAQPYMRPAFDQESENVIQEISNALNDAIMEAIK